MQLDFEMIKRIRIVDVLAVRYGVKARLKLGGDWANCRCPLPSHRTDDRGNPFSVNLEKNFWQCKSDSCIEKSGVKGGDVVNLVALMENVSQYEAGKLLVEWFKKPAPQGSGPAEGRGHHPSGSPPANTSENNMGSGNGKGFMQETALWLDEVLKIVPEEERAKTKKLIAARIYESYKNGKSASI